jgi:hypothetical protein
MEENPSREANNCSTSQEVSRFLVNPKPQYHIQKAVALLKLELYTKFCS